MGKAIVGYTGFVGGNIYASGDFDAAYNTKNISEAYGTHPDLLVFAGLRAEKYLANSAPEKDLDLIIQAEQSISRIQPKQLVLISTIDVFKNPKDVNEDTHVDTENLPAYGLNRYQFEQWAREQYPDALIIRLPGLFGRNIKKNFIYDYINVIPSMLKEDTFAQLAEKDPELNRFYTLQENHFYKVHVLESDREDLKDRFLNLGFSALNFTDSRSIYQFYNLNRLWDDIQTVLKAGLTLWHPATEPVSVRELYRFLTGNDFENELLGTPADYDYHTKYAEVFGKTGHYICNKNEVLEEIRTFVQSYGGDRLRIQEAAGQQ